MTQSNQTKTPKTLRKTIIMHGTVPVGVEFEFTRLGKRHAMLLSDLVPFLRDYAACHGIAQKLGDVTAIPRDPVTGRSATDGEKYAAFCDTYNRLMEATNLSDWNATRTVTAPPDYLREALCRMYAGKKTPEQVDTLMATWSDAEKNALKVQNPRVRDLIAVIQAERIANVEAPSLDDLPEDDESDSE